MMDEGRRQEFQVLRNICNTSCNFCGYYRRMENATVPMPFMCLLRGDLCNGGNCERYRQAVIRIIDINTWENFNNSYVCCEYSKILKIKCGGGKDT